MPSSPASRGAAHSGRNTSVSGLGPGSTRPAAVAATREACPVGDHAEAAQGHGESWLIDHRPQGQCRRPIAHPCRQGKAQLVRGHTWSRSDSCGIGGGNSAPGIGGPPWRKARPHGPLWPVWHAWLRHDRWTRLFVLPRTARGPAASPLCTSVPRRRRCGLYQSPGGCTAPPDGRAMRARSSPGGPAGPRIAAPSLASRTGARKLRVDRSGLRSHCRRATEMNEVLMNSQVGFSGIAAGLSRAPRRSSLSAPVPPGCRPRTSPAA